MITLQWFNTRSEKKAISLKHVAEALFKSDSFLVETLWHVWGSFIKCVYNEGLSPNRRCIKTALHTVEIILTTKASRQKRWTVDHRSQQTKWTWRGSCQSSRAHCVLQRGTLPTCSQLLKIPPLQHHDSSPWFEPNLSAKYEACCWGTILRESLTFLHILWAEALTAFLTGCPFKHFV